MERAGGEEERDLGDRVGGDVDGGTEDRHRRQEGGAEDDIGELADGRISEPALEIVLAERHQRGDDDGEAGDIDQPVAGVGGGQRLDAEDIDDDLEDGEDPGLDHGDGMEEGRHRGRRDHRRRQPEMHRHHRRLGDAEDIEGKENAERDRSELAAQDAARDEIEGAGGGAGPGDRRQEEEGRGAEEHQEIEAPGAHRFRRRPVGDQRIGRKGEHLVKEEQREEVAGERQPHGRGDGDGEADIEERLPVGPLVAQIADRVDRIDDPQPRGDEREEHAEGLDGEGDWQAGDDIDEVERRPAAGEHRRQQRQDRQEEQDGSDERHALAEVRAAGEERQQQRRGGGDHERREDEVFGGHGVAASPMVEGSRP